MSEITPGTEPLLRQIESAFPRFRKRRLEAMIPKPEWNDLNPEKRGERLQEQMDTAIAKNAHELHALTEEVNDQIKKIKRDVDKKLRPLQTSDNPEKRLEGLAFDEKADRIVTTLPQKGVESEYARALELNQIDLASGIIHWIVQRSKDADTIEQKEYVRRVKHQHDEWAGLPMLNRSIEVLQLRIDQLGRGNPFAKESLHLTDQIMLRQNDREFADKLQQIA